MKILFKTHKFPFLIVAATLLIFAALLPILPAEMASHLSANGSANEMSSKFSVFLLFVLADIGLTLIWTALIDSPGRMALMINQRLKFILSLYLPLLMAAVLIMLLLAAFGLNGLAVIIGFHLIYLVAVVIVIFKK